MSGAGFVEGLMARARGEVAALRSRAQPYFAPEPQGTEMPEIEAVTEATAAPRSEVRVEQPGPAPAEAHSVSSPERASAPAVAPAPPAPAPREHLMPLQTAPPAAGREAVGGPGLPVAPPPVPAAVVPPAEARDPGPDPAREPPPAPAPVATAPPPPEPERREVTVDLARALARLLPEADAPEASAARLMPPEPVVPPPAAVPAPPAAPQPERAQPVTIHIGEIVIAPDPPPQAATPPRPAARPRWEPQLSLAEYREQRRRGER